MCFIQLIQLNVILEIKPLRHRILLNVDTENTEDQIKPTKPNLTK